MKLRKYLYRLLHRRALQELGIGPDVRFARRHLAKLIDDRKEWLRQGGEITCPYPILNDYEDNAGTAHGHYFHQDLLVASYIFKNNPVRHIDVGSRIDGLVAHVAAFRKIEVFDMRPLNKSIHSNIIFQQANMMDDDQSEIADSVSCLHAIEHFGLGRYSDPIDVDGHKKGIKNLVGLVKSGGVLYISCPIGAADEVHFNAHRVFHPRSLVEMPESKDYLSLQKFDYVDDHGDLHINSTLDHAVGKVIYGCGIYTFRKL